MCSKLRLEIVLLKDHVVGEFLGLCDFSAFNAKVKIQRSETISSPLSEAEK